MVYTVTFNPALDYVVWVEKLTVGGANRAGQAEIQPGGKGINVSCVLHDLGVETTALGFVAGFTGCELERELARRGVRTEFIHLAEGQTRINVKLKGQEETEINAAGPVIPPEAQRRLLEQLDALQAGDVLVVSGSVPACMPGGSYETLLRRVEGAETALFALGFTDFRVRLYDDAARLQLPEGQLAKAVEQRQAIRQALAPWFDIVLLDTQTR